VVRSIILRHGPSNNCYFVDVSKAPSLTDQQHLETICKQYGGALNFHGVKMLGPRQNRYFVLYPSQSILPKFLVEGIYYEDAKTRILPCKAIEGQGKIIRLNLSDIPIIEKAEIISKLTESLSTFGTLLDLGLTYESTMGWFMGSGYAIIQQDDNGSYPTLHHKITLSRDEYCFAAFPEMKMWCRYCHEEGHSKFTCQKAKANILCFDCHNYGHKSEDCLSPQSAKRQEMTPKKKRKSPLSSTQDHVVTTTPRQPAATVTPSDSLLRSKHAQPTPTTVETPASSSSATPAPEDDMEEDEEEDEDYVLSYSIGIQRESELLTLISHSVLRSRLF
jgi:hypothetical protein